MAELIVHVGCPKCGSTMLQRYVFPELDGVRYIDFRGESEIYQALALRAFPDGESARNDVLARFAEAVTAADRPTLISAEHFVMPAAAFRGLPGRPLRLLDGADILDRLAGLPVSIRVVTLLRRQDQWLRSWHQERVKRYETRGFAAFAAAPDNAHLLDVLAYDRMLSALEGRFGTDAIVALPFELLTHDPASFWDRLRAVLPMLPDDIDPPRVRTSMRDETVVLRRLGNRARRGLAALTGGETAFDRLIFRGLKSAYAMDSMFDRVMPRRPADATLPPDVLERFRPDNRALADRLSSDLAALGYPC